MTPTRVTIHCSDTPNGKEISLEHVEKDHIARGFGGIGYHAIIQPDGQTIQTRSYAEKGCHVAQFNTGNIGICLAGNDKFTQVQLKALWDLLDAILRTYPTIPRWGIKVHNEFTTATAQGKTCPNMDGSRVRDWFVTRDPESIKPYVMERA